VIDTSEKRRGGTTSMTIGTVKGCITTPVDGDALVTVRGDIDTHTAGHRNGPAARAATWCCGR
jgi:hypothetical protein